MALTYEDTAALMKDMDFRARISVACIHYADYIVAEAVSTPAHNTRYKWAQNTLIAPDVAAALVTPTVCNDAAVQQDGKNVTDAALQSATEAAVNKLL